MFTGLVQDIGIIQSIDKDGDWTITIKTALEMNNHAIGASICCAGCCLTVTEKATDTFTVEVSHETLSKTTIRNWEQGTRINLEPSLKMGDELGGHFVFGHVDGKASVQSIAPHEDSHIITIKPPQNLMQYIAPKGSVTLDGVSLTVNGVQEDTFDVNIIPHTWQKTTLSNLQPNDEIHIEIDMLARYVARITQYNAGQEP